LKLFFLKSGHPVPAVLQRVTGSVKTEGRSSDGTPRKSKKVRTEGPQGFEATPQSDIANIPSQSFTEGQWSQTAVPQGQDLTGQNVDPGLQMPKGS
jgi:hypothetical protein